MRAGNDHISDSDRQRFQMTLTKNCMIRWRRRGSLATARAVCRCAEAAFGAIQQVALLSVAARNDCYGAALNEMTSRSLRMAWHHMRVTVRTINKHKAQALQACQLNVKTSIRHTSSQFWNNDFCGSLQNNTFTPRIKAT